MSKIVKNQTIADIDLKDVGVTIPASGQITIPPVDYLLWAESTDIITSITAGDIILNDGIDDLGITASKYHVKYPDSAFNSRFLDNTQRSNGFAAKNVQEAIEENRNLIVAEFEGKLIDFEFATIGTTFNKWVNVGHPSSSSDDIPYVCSWAGQVIGISYANTDDESDIDLELYKNGTLAYTWQIRSKRTAWTVNSATPFLTASQGDRISLFAKKVVGGDNPSNISGEVIIRVLTAPDGSGGTETGV